MELLIAYAYHAELTMYRSLFPHHGAVACGHYGKALFEVFKDLGVRDIAYNQPRSLPDPTENPWD